MSFLVFVLIASAVTGGLMVRRVWLRQRREQLRDQARLKVIESQMAGLRATLRIRTAEQVTRRRLHHLHDRDVFANSTTHEEPEAWQ